MKHLLYRLPILLTAVLIATIILISTHYLVQTVAAASPIINEQNDTCFVEYTGDNQTDASSSDATALQEAIDLVPANSLIKISGLCAGVQFRSSMTQTVFIDKSLTLQGGYAYTDTDWLAAPDPGIYTAFLDAEENGRVIFIATGADVTLDGLGLLNGNSSVAGGPSEGGGIYSLGNLIITQSIVFQNHAQQGGGIWSQGGLFIGESRIDDNTSDQDGAGILAFDKLTIAHSWIINNTAADRGGGFFAHGTGNLITITNSTLRHNTSNGRGGGGGYIGTGVELTVDNSTFDDNRSAQDGGGLMLESDTSAKIADSFFVGGLTQGSGSGLYSEGLVDLTAVTFGGNWGGGNGGGVAIVNSGRATLSQSVFTFNRAVHGGGLYLAGEDTTSHIIGTEFSENEALWGGGLYAANALLTLQNSIFRDNLVEGGSGGGLALLQTTASVEQSVIQGNESDTQCSGIHSQDSIITLLKTAVSFNWHIAANVNGGGICNIATHPAFEATLALNRTVVAANRAHQGGGIFNSGSAAVVTAVNSSIFNNEALIGGGLYNDGTATLHHVTITQNTGGGLYQTEATSDSLAASANLEAPIIANNGQQNCQGEIPISHGYNLTSDATCQLSEIGDLNNTAPLLEPILVENDLPQFYMLTRHSLGLNHIPLEACKLTTDQRGFSRPVGMGCDVGAVENSRLHLSSSANDLPTSSVRDTLARR